MFTDKYQTERLFARDLMLSITHVSILKALCCVGWSAHVSVFCGYMCLLKSHMVKWKRAGSVCTMSVKMMKEGCKSNKAKQTRLSEERIHLHTSDMTSPFFHKMFAVCFSWNVWFINALGFMKVDRVCKCELTAVHSLTLSTGAFTGKTTSSTSWCRSRTAPALSHALSQPFGITQTSSLGNRHMELRPVSEN